MTGRTYFEHVAGTGPQLDIVDGDPAEEAPLLRVTIGKPEDFCMEHAEALPCPLCVLFAAMEDRS